MPNKKSESSLPRLQQILKTENLNGLYLFTGEETFNKDYYVSRFKNAFKNDPMPDFNVLTFDGKETNSGIILNAIESYPVMSENKLIIIKNSGIFKSVSESDKAVWDELFENPPSYAVIIFDESETDGRSALLKKLKSKGLFVSFDYLPPAEFSGWIKTYLKNRGFNITPEALTEFLNRSDGSMGSAHNELDKLINYCSGKNEITKDDVCLVITKSLQDKIFDMLDGIILKKRDIAFSILSDLKLLREEPAKIVSLLASSISGILKTKLFTEEGVSDIASQLALPPFVVKKYTHQSSKLSKKQLKHMLSLCLEADKGIKIEGKEKWSTLETLMIELSK